MIMGSRLAIVIAIAFLLQTVRSQVPTRSNSGEAAENERGKKIFVARCARRHDDDMKKQLSDGSNLFARLGASKDPRLRLGTRLKYVQERDAVTNYFFGLQVTFGGK